MNEKRQDERLRPGVKISVYNRDTNEFFGYLADISETGMMLIAEDMVTHDGLYRLKMEMPVEIDGCCEVNLDAESIWCKCDPESYYNKAGFRLSNVTPEVAEVIRKFARTSEFQNMAGYVPNDAV